VQAQLAQQQQSSASRSFTFGLSGLTSSGPPVLPGFVRASASQAAASEPASASAAPTARLVESQASAPPAVVSNGTSFRFGQASSAEPSSFMTGSAPPAATGSVPVIIPVVAAVSHVQVSSTVPAEQDAAAPPARNAAQAGAIPPAALAPAAFGAWLSGTSPAAAAADNLPATAKLSGLAPAGAAAVLPAATTLTLSAPSLFPASAPARAAGSVMIKAAQPAVSVAAAPLPPASASVTGPVSAAAGAASSAPPVRLGPFGIATVTERPTFSFGRAPTLGTAAAPSAAAASKFTFGSASVFRGLPKFGAAPSVVASTLATSAAAAGSQPPAAAPGPFGSPPRPSFPPLRSQAAAAPAAFTFGSAFTRTPMPPSSIPPARPPSLTSLPSGLTGSVGAAIAPAAAPAAAANQATVNPPQPAAGAQSDRPATTPTLAPAALNHAADELPEPGAEILLCYSATPQALFLLTVMLRLTASSQHPG